MTIIDDSLVDFTSIKELSPGLFIAKILNDDFRRFLLSLLGL